MPTVRCECGTVLQASPEMAGEKCVCSKCRRTVRVPFDAPGSISGGAAVTNTLGQMMSQAPDQRLTLGTQRELGRGWSLDLSAAYVFDRQIFQAEKFSGTRRDELAIDPGPAGMLQLLWTR